MKAIVELTFAVLQGLLPGLIRLCTWLCDDWATMTQMRL